MEQAQHRIAVMDRVFEIIATHDDILVANLGNLTYTPATNAYGTPPTPTSPSSSRTTAARRMEGERYLSPATTISRSTIRQRAGPQPPTIAYSVLHNQNLVVYASGVLTNDTDAGCRRPQPLAHRLLRQWCPR